MVERLSEYIGKVVFVATIKGSQNRGILLGVDATGISFCCMANVGGKIYSPETFIPWMMLDTIVTEGDSNKAQEYEGTRVSVIRTDKGGVN